MRALWHEADADSAACSAFGTTRITSLLSYWRDYFRPGVEPRFPNHSTGWIAERLHGLLKSRGSVLYVDRADKPSGIEADVFIGHFWAFASTCLQNDVGRKIAVYVLSDPVRARNTLMEQALRYGVPFPEWDLPPAEFDHEATMTLADVVLLVGNTTTLETFDDRWREKIRLVNYAPNEVAWSRPSRVVRRREFVYAATHCGLRKGFLDVIDTWQDIPAFATRLHVIGRLDDPYSSRLRTASSDSVIVHGWIPSHTDAYVDLMRSCCYAYVPTWVEGQVGTVLEAIAAGCIPITTRASGIDDRVLAHCVLVEPGAPEQHRHAIADALSWTDDEVRERQQLLRTAMARHHSWKAFDEQVREAMDA
jgi:glycosyltransferase involved in cell wall biosynthesis